MTKKIDIEEFYQRDDRQRIAYDWAVRAFGIEQCTNEKQRALRFLEEAIELYQACGGSEELASKLLHFVFGRPVGEKKQEVGGVGVTLLVLCEHLGISANEEEFKELKRVMSKPLEEFVKRNQQKNDAGFFQL